MSETPTEARALAVMRRNETELLYEAWLYHHPHLRVVSFGMEVTKLQLQELIRSIPEDVYRQQIDAEDISDALATVGRDVVVFFILHRDAMADFRPGLYWFPQTNPGQALQPPSSGPPARVIPEGQPTPDPAGIPIPRRPLPPYLEAPHPVLDPGPLTLPDLQCLAALDGIFHWGLSAAMLPDIAVGQPLVGTGTPEAPYININSAIYNRFIAKFADACTHTFGSFGNTDSEGRTVPGTLDVKVSTT